MNIDTFKPHGYYTISNTGGYEIELHPSGDSARVRYYDNEVSDWLDISWDNEGEAFIDQGGLDIPLNMVMRIDGQSHKSQNITDSYNMKPFKYLKFVRVDQMLNQRQEMHAYVPGINSGAYDKALVVEIKNTKRKNRFSKKLISTRTKIVLYESDLRDLQKEINNILKLEYDQNWGACRPPSNY